MKYLILVVFFATLCQTSWTNYVAGVLEYEPLSSTSPTTTIELNIREYISQIEIAKRSGVQILVFPEYGLTGLQDDPTDYAIEIPSINSGTTFENHRLQQLSNAAYEHSMYLVVNLLEKSRNENNDTIYYNTNVVFHTNGNIIAKYRKINLFNEPNLTPGNETVTFETDFGKFAIFTCFDILFYHPSRSVLDNTVNSVVYTSAWTSVLPFYHSLTVQVGYAQANRVSLLASDLNSPALGIGGSGIYASDGTVLSYYLSGINSTKLLVSEVKESINPFETFGFDIIDNNSQSELSYFNTLRDFQSSNYEFKNIELSSGVNVEETLCDGSFCCQFSITFAEANSSEIYKLLAYDGPTKLGDSNGNIKVCTLVACETSDSGTCGSRSVTISTKIRQISISANDTDYQIDHFFQPVTLTTNLLPVYNTTFTSSVNNITNAVVINSTHIVEKVVIFGLFGRGAAAPFGSSVLLIVAVGVFKYLFDVIVV